MRECDRDNGKSIAILQGTPDEFREWLGAPKSYTYGQFKDKILKPAVEEINLKLMIWTWKFFKADIIVKLFKLKYITTGQLIDLNKKEDCSSLKKCDLSMMCILRIQESENTTPILEEQSM